MITLYDYGMAPSPRRARILLAEKGISHATVSVDLTQAREEGKVSLVLVSVGPVHPGYTPTPHAEPGDTEQVV